ncbi:MAG: hypothetical protein Q8O31_08785, partial [Rhodocyclaceae bacterium]|nr:hypothetical protein [Rhodocyclaceae bacterium]
LKGREIGTALHLKGREIGTALPLKGREAATTASSTHYKPHRANMFHVKQSMPYVVEGATCLTFRRVAEEKPVLK